MTQPNYHAKNANLIKLVNVAYKEIAITSCNLGVCDVDHVLQQITPSITILQNSDK